MKMTMMAALALALVSASASANVKSKGSNAVLLEAKDIHWAPVEGFKGVQMATVEGNAAKGASHNFMKFDAGFSAPLHHHSADHFGTVISGTLVLTVDGEEHQLPAGSFFSFKKKSKHATACAAGTDCVISIDARSKWDVIPDKK